MKAHNAARAKHCAQPLEWSPAIAKVAQAWADQLKAKGCVFGHSNNNKYGENLAAGTIGALDPESTVAMWYDEIKLYKFPNGGFSMKTGHFTQLVWTDTTQVGCGHVQCNGNDIYVCNYNPPGNWEGQYREHVLPSAVTARLAVEAASPLGWERWTGSRGAIIGLDRFGASAPGETVMRELGFSVEAVVERALALAG